MSEAPSWAPIHNAVLCPVKQGFGGAPASLNAMIKALGAQVPTEGESVNRKKNKFPVHVWYNDNIMKIKQTKAKTDVDFSAEQ